MNIETKIVRKDVPDYAKFGWKQTGTTKSGGRARHTEYVLSRDKDMPNYRLILALENKYFSLKSQLKTYSEVDIGTAIVLFLLFVLPFVIYIGFKMHQKWEVDANNSTILSKMKDVEKEVAPLLRGSI